MPEVHRRPGERDISEGATRINTDPVGREQRCRVRHTNIRPQSTNTKDAGEHPRRRLRRVAVSLHLHLQHDDHLLLRSDPQPTGGPNCAISDQHTRYTVTFPW
ncbi:uncharacterized protein LOC125230211 [Leguminivora glycinivorella]|uniref:uncharacterized protein LOC125226385 n=1 Tax=Leguminivora glycinivorella TaxID=1035111 RepID=UPI00200FCE55|nr:uncharacterized protein LOC125226385 [Leguminivora glycinivorella]XP_047991252.1 uncharacterized protein LOC125230211 [Leguminivora glycinivorella]